jgi:glycine oxidase
MTDALIIGGGIIGLLTARELSMAGAQVTVLEKNELARESSWAGGGIISPLYPWRYPNSVTRLASWSQQVYAELCENLKSDTGIDPQYVKSGLIISAPEEHEQALDWAIQAGHSSSTLINSAQISELEPGHSNPPSSAIYMPEVAQVRNPRLVKALIHDITRRGVKILTQTAADHFSIRKNKVEKVITATDNLSADNFILCAGAWTASLMQNLPCIADIRPVRGQMLLFKAKPGLIQHIMLEENRYIIPRKDGRILFGSTLEETDFDKSTTRSARAELEQLATERYPMLKQFPIEHHWAGLRPASPAGVPYIARHPQLKNMFVSAGHYRNGVVLAPASTRLLVDLVLNRKPVLNPVPYSMAAPRG